jgi:cell division protein FtsB
VIKTSDDLLARRKAESIGEWLKRKLGREASITECQLELIREENAALKARIGQLEDELRESHHLAKIAQETRGG